MMIKFGVTLLITASVAEASIISNEALQSYFEPDQALKSEARD